MRTVSLMGSTGSVGTQALDVIRTEPERFRVHALAAQRSVEELLAQAAAFGPALVVIGDPGRYAEVRDGVPAGTEVMVGEEGMVAAAQAPTWCSTRWWASPACLSPWPRSRQASGWRWPTRSR